MQDIADLFHRVCPSTASLGLAAGAVLFSAIMRGLTGFGFAIAAVPLLSLFLDPKMSVAISTLLQLVFAFTDAPRAWAKAHTPVLPPLLIGALIGTPVGMLCLRLMPQSFARLAIALAATTAFVVVLRSDSLRGERIASNPGPVGFLSGLLNGLASMPGPPVVVYFLSAPVSAMTARASMIVFFAATAILATVSGIAVGIINTAALVVAAACLPALLVGNFVGTAFFHAADVRFYRVAGLFLLAAGAGSAAWKGLDGLL